ncbi:MAG TPA: aminotransferase class V-fold PLP-dependent enzyme [Planctomycetota bacterium]|nr:aminotransferase class V-fold PLP-dependent enzyme [Planctomycetota bacterium]
MIYLDNAATSFPKPESVYRAMDEFARTWAGNPGRSGHRLAVESEKRVQGCREAVARLLNAESPDRVVLTLNATDGLNIAQKGVLRAGDHVITSPLEHNSINRPLGRMARDGMIRVDRAEPAPDGHVPPENVRRLFRKETRLLAITHCSNVLGVLNPVEEYCRLARERGVLTLLDVSQSVGVVPIDVQKLGADLVAFPGHKNLFGPMGTGALYVRSGVEVGVFREGGTGFKADVELQPEEMPYRLEGGTPNAHGYAGLQAGIEFVLAEGIRKIGDHERALALAFAEGLRSQRKVTLYSAQAPDRQLGPVSLQIKGAEPARVGRLMDETYGIACRPGLHCAPGTHRFLGTLPGGTVRFSFGYFNTEAHVEAALRAVHEVAAGV